MDSSLGVVSRGQSTSHKHAFHEEVPIFVETPDYAPIIARCLAFPHEPKPELINLVDAVLKMPPRPDRAVLEDMQRKIDTTEAARNSIDIVYGGATKIKGYVFESPKLPEIRGASALLDWVNESELPRLWGAVTPADYVACGIIYASGGNILAFAPTSQGATRAAAIERIYTSQTLTANSVAVTRSFQLLELRFGRNPLSYWVDEFMADWNDTSKQRLLTNYYYLPDPLPHEVASGSIDATRWRFYNRKTFGELVTLLATMANRRRDEQASHGEPRSLPRYELLPWAVKCQSSDVRPAAVVAQVGSDQRLLSEASARKLVVGRAVKDDRKNDLEILLQPWNVPDGLEQRSWERQWKSYLQNEGRDSQYAQHPQMLRARAARDTHEIGATSSRYIGLIYADGNNIGRLIATLKTPSEYHQVSDLLRDATRTSVFRALAKHLQPVELYEENGRTAWIHPFEILAIGGDDLFIIVPGDRAFDIVLEIGRIFEHELTQKFGALMLTLSASEPLRSRYAGQAIPSTPPPLIGLSAGVLIAQEQAPIFFLRDLVEELLKSAKSLAKWHASPRDKEGHHKPRFFGGAVDFMVLKSITMVTDKVKGFRKTALGEGSPRRLIARPYTWDEFAGLLTTIRALKDAGVPRSQLYRLRRVLETGESANLVVSVMEYLYTRSRLSSGPASSLITHLEHAWCHGPQFANGRKGLPPWMPVGEHGYETIWLDLLEAYEFVPRQEVRCLSCRLP